MAGETQMSLLSPATEEEAAGLVADAAARHAPLGVSGAGSKAEIGRPAQTEATLSSSGLTGITLYEPAEQVVAARAGTPLAEIVATLAARGQHLAFEPLDYRPLLGSTAEPTIGSVAACNLSGPRRIQIGAARDALLGVRFVNGRGEIVKSGGRVMKNVTGLDLVKLLAGSWGTLGFLTEVTFKVSPVAERAATLVLSGLDDTAAVAALSAGLGSPFEISGAAHLPAGIGADRARTLLRTEGFTFSVDHRLAELRRLFKRAGEIAVVEGEEAAGLWRRVRDADFLAEPRDRAIWRISTAPRQGPLVVAAIARSHDARWFFDWGGGLIWLSLPATGDAGAEAVRAAVKASGGHATLIRAPAEVRAAVDVFQPLDAVTRRITEGVKASFDPSAILNPGRMHAGL
jgi:glycolate oxidase FAD binding subunit